MKSIKKIFIDIKANKYYINIPLLKVIDEAKSFSKKLIDANKRKC